MTTHRNDGMSDEPMAHLHQGVPELLASLSIAIVFVAAGEAAFCQSPFTRPSIDSGPECPSMKPLRRRTLVRRTAGGSLQYYDYLWFDEWRGEVLCAALRNQGDLLAGNAIDRLTRWSVERTNRP